MENKMILNKRRATEEEKKRERDRNKNKRKVDDKPSGRSGREDTWTPDNEKDTHIRGPSGIY
jgi:hypothetical protein